jgi:hypothetical protein
MNAQAQTGSVFRSAARIASIDSSEILTTAFGTGERRPIPNDSASSV